MRRCLIALTAAGSIALVAAGLVTGAIHRPAASTIKVALAPGGNDSKLQPTPTVTKAGKVTFLVKNYSHDHKVYGVLETAEAHELVVLRTNRAPDKLPERHGGVHNGEAIETGRVGPPVVLDPGKSGRVTFQLKPGNYVLICNLQGHYATGQYAALKVVG